MTYGAVDFLALEFKGNKFRGEILKELNKLMSEKIIRVIDMVIIYKDAQGDGDSQRDPGTRCGISSPSLIPPKWIPRA